jgi:hypothetical protein
MGYKNQIHAFTKYIKCCTTHDAQHNDLFHGIFLNMWRFFMLSWCHVQQNRHIFFYVIMCIYVESYNVCKLEFQQV